MFGSNLDSFQQRSWSLDSAVVGFAGLWPLGHHQLYSQPHPAAAPAKREGPVSAPEPRGPAREGAHSHKGVWARLFSKAQAQRQVGRHDFDNENHPINLVV